MDWRLLLVGKLQLPIVNTKDPISKPWAAEQMQATNEEVLGGKRRLLFISQSALLAWGHPLRARPRKKTE